MADVTIASLTAAADLAGTDILVGERSGVTVKIPVTVLRAALDALGVAVVNTSSTSYNLADATNAARVTRFTAATAVTATLQTVAAGGFALGDVLTLRQVGAGQVTVTPSATVTINIPTGASAKTRVQGSTIMLHLVDTASGGTWDLTGDLAAA